MMGDEKGQALPLALLALAAGALMVTPFLGHTSTTLIGTRLYGQAIIEQYSADAGIEWALWRLGGNPVLTTNTTYDATPLEPFPGEINNSSFPATELRFVEFTEDTRTIPLEWQDGQGEHNYDFNATDNGLIAVVIDNITASKPVIVELSQVPGQPDYEFQGDGPYIAVFEIDSAGSYTILVTLPRTNKYGPLGPGPITITIYENPVVVYDIRAQEGDRTITVRATASYLATWVISWQTE